MNLVEAIRSGREFTCGAEGEFPWFSGVDDHGRYLENGQRSTWSVNANDYARDDWRLKPIDGWEAALDIAAAWDTFKSGYMTIEEVEQVVKHYEAHIDAYVERTK